MSKQANREAQARQQALDAIFNTTIGISQSTALVERIKTHALLTDAPYEQKIALLEACQNRLREQNFEFPWISTVIEAAKSYSHKKNPSLN